MILLKGHSDRAVQNHRHVTGATDTYWLNELVRYVRGQGLWDNFVLYPMMPKTNYGTGTSVRPLGGLTSNAMTLVNGPTWGASGLAFASASSQYGTIADPTGTGTLTVFMRSTLNPAPPAGITRLYGQGDVPLNLGSIFLSYAGNVSGDPFRILRSPDGTGTTGNAGIYDTSDETQTTEDQCLVNQFVDGGGILMWQNKTELTTSLFTGSTTTSRYDSSESFYFNTFINDGSILQPSDQTAHALAFITGSLTDTQRETITDLINAL